MHTTQFFSFSWGYTHRQTGVCIALQGSPCYSNRVWWLKNVQKQWTGWMETTGESREDMLRKEVRFNCSYLGKCEKEILFRYPNTGLWKRPSPFWDVVFFLGARHFSLRREGLTLGNYCLGTDTCYVKLKFRGTNPCYLTLYNSLVQRSLAASSLWALSPRPSMHAHTALPPRSMLSPSSSTVTKTQGDDLERQLCFKCCSRGSSLAATCKRLGELLGLGSLPLPWAGLPCCRGAGSSQLWSVGFAFPPLVPRLCIWSGSVSLQLLACNKIVLQDPHFGVNHRSRGSSEREEGDI